jgi:hypothetical protein
VRPADIPDAPTRRGWVSTTVSPYFDAIRTRVHTLEVTWKPSRHHRTPPTTGPTTEPNNQPTEPAEPAPNTGEPTNRTDPTSRGAEAPPRRGHQDQPDQEPGPNPPTRPPTTPPAPPHQSQPDPTHQPQHPTPHTPQPTHPRQQSTELKVKLDF